MRPRMRGTAHLLEAEFTGPLREKINSRAISDTGLSQRIFLANFPAISNRFRGGFADDSEPSKLGAGGKENRREGYSPRVFRELSVTALRDFTDPSHPLRKQNELTRISRQNALRRIATVWTTPTSMVVCKNFPSEFPRD